MLSLSYPLYYQDFDINDISDNNSSGYWDCCGGGDAGCVGYADNTGFGDTCGSAIGDEDGCGDGDGYGENNGSGSEYLVGMGGGCGKYSDFTGEG
jgi:hypothetical protein